MKQMISLWRSTSASDVEGNLQNDPPDPPSEERKLEHVVVVRSVRVYDPHIQEQILEEGGSFHVRPCSIEPTSKFQNGPCHRSR